MSDIIQRLKDAYAENPAKALELLPELFKAADEGKIVVLPCKVGATVYTTRWWDDTQEKCTDSKGKEFFRTIHKSKITKEPFTPFGLDYSEFGMDVFLTREATEKALEDKNETNIV